MKNIPANDGAATNDMGAAGAHSLVHFVNQRPLLPPWPDSYEEAIVAMGCFWGAERLFWELPGVWVTMVGYTGGHDKAPSYATVCEGLTGHAEAVRVVYDPAIISYKAILQKFWENHNPTQGMRQGNDIGAQYRSALFPVDQAQMELAKQSKTRFQHELHANGLGEITTLVVPAGPFYLAEEGHQQYLAKNVDGYCNLRGTGVQCAI